jgi:hypothetical protein
MGEVPALLDTLLPPLLALADPIAGSRAQRYLNARTGLLYMFDQYKELSPDFSQSVVERVAALCAQEGSYSDASAAMVFCAVVLDALHARVTNWQSVPTPSLISLSPSHF